jgi:hypothetical protein
MQNKYISNSPIKIFAKFLGGETSVLEELKRPPSPELARSITFTSEMLSLIGLNLALSVRFVAQKLNFEKS